MTPAVGDSVDGVEALETAVGHLLFAVPVADEFFADLFRLFNRILRLCFFAELIVTVTLFLFEFFACTLPAANGGDDGNQECDGVELMSHDADSAVPWWELA